MLYITFKCNENTVKKRVTAVFENEFERSWLSDPLVKEMIMDVDKSDVRRGTDIESPVLGPISPRELSGGVKCLILMYCTDEYSFASDLMGDNCAKWVLRIAESKDVTLVYRHIFKLEPPFTAVMVEDGSTVTDRASILDKADALGVDI